MNEHRWEARGIGAWVLAGAALAALAATGCGSSKNNGAGPGPEAGTGSSSGSASGASAGTASGSSGGSSGSGSSTGASGASAGTSSGSGSTSGAPEGGSDAGDAGEGGSPMTCTPFDAGTLDDGAVAAGFAFIENVGHCYKCHQTNPDAGLALSGNMNSISDAAPVFPPNLTSDPATGLGCFTNDQIANAILFGIDPGGDGGKLCSAMPKFGIGRGDAAPALDDASVYNVVELLRSLPVVSYQAQMTVCPVMGTGSGSDAGDAGDAGAGGDAGDAAGE